MLANLIVPCALVAGAAAQQVIAGSSGTIISGTGGITIEGQDGTIFSGPSGLTIEGSTGTVISNADGLETVIGVSGVVVLSNGNVISAGSNTGGSSPTPIGGSPGITNPALTKSGSSASTATATTGAPGVVSNGAGTAPIVNVYMMGGLGAIIGVVAAVL